jgi:hypothetical protein
MRCQSLKNVLEPPGLCFPNMAGCDAFFQVKNFGIERQVPVHYEYAHELTSFSTRDVFLSLPFVTRGRARKHFGKEKKWREKKLAGKKFGGKKIWRGKKFGGEKKLVCHLSENAAAFYRPLWMGIGVLMSARRFYVRPQIVHNHKQCIF